MDFERLLKKFTDFLGVTERKTHQKYSPDMEPLPSLHRLFLEMTLDNMTELCSKEIKAEDGKLDPKDIPLIHALEHFDAAKNFLSCQKGVFPMSLSDKAAIHLHLMLSTLHSHDVSFDDLARYSFNRNIKGEFNDLSKRSGLRDFSFGKETDQIINEIEQKKKNPPHLLEINPQP